jgi:hypothetical protein
MKKIIISISLLLIRMIAAAQDGNAGINEATTQSKATSPPAPTCLLHPIQR